MSNYSSEFLSKDNITEIYKNVINKNNLNKISNKHKQEVVDKLIKIIKSTYKTLDMDKINDKNIASVKNNLIVFVPIILYQIFKM